MDATLVEPLLVLEMVAFWPLAVGIAALIAHRRLVVLLKRASNRSYDDLRERALNRSVVYSALLLIDIGLGATVWSYASGSRTPIFVAALLLGLALAALSVANGAAVVRGRRELPHESAEASGSASASPSDSNVVGRAPYAGIAESAVAKMLINEADPVALARRTKIHRLSVISTVIFAVAALVIIGAMLVAVISNFQH